VSKTPTIFKKVREKRKTKNEKPEKRKTHHFLFFVVKNEKQNNTAYRYHQNPEPQ
jgi:hypothetical protein